MRIDSSYIGMESSRKYSSFTARKLSFGALTQKKGSLSLNNGMGNLLGDEKADMAAAEENGEGKSKILQNKRNKMNYNFGANRITYRQGSAETYGKIMDQCMKYLMEILAGKDNPWNFKDLFSGNSAASNAGYTVAEYKEQLYYEESESTSFSTTGTVKCADGRQINFNLEMQMSRKFTAYYEKNYQSVQPKVCDPLVINLDSNIASMSDQKFLFDLDADGKEEMISMLGAGSGYLALDKNGDGTINDGNELFGPQSGNGFADLAKYDSDKNGWIDENDDIWSKLLIWTKDQNGEDRCFSLSQKNVGAICLSNAATDFSLNSTDNKTNGIIRKTGVFLYESGEVGTVQHLDVAH